MSQRVLITAAATGIGRVVAEAFVGQGARVHLCDVNEEALAEVSALSPLVSASRGRSGRKLRNSAAVSNAPVRISLPTRGSETRRAPRSPS